MSDAPDAPLLVTPPPELTLWFCMTCGSATHRSRPSSWSRRNHAERCAGEFILLTYRGPVSRPFTDAERAEHGRIMAEAKSRGQLITWRAE